LAHLCHGVTIRAFVLDWIGHLPVGPARRDHEAQELREAGSEKKHQP
jgi:hypothetical protein